MCVYIYEGAQVLFTFYNGGQWNSRQTITSTIHHPLRTFLSPPNIVFRSPYRNIPNPVHNIQSTNLQSGKHCRFRSPYLNITNPTPFHNIPSILIHHIWSPLLEVDSIFLLLTMFCAFSFKNKTLRRRHRMNMRESFHILVSWVKTSQGDEWKSFPCSLVHCHSCMKK